MFVRFASLLFVASLAACAADPSVEQPEAAATSPVVQKPALPDLTAAHAVAFPADQPFGSHSLGDYANFYWNWYVSVPKSRHPMLGAKCDPYQGDSVHYLPGSLSEGKIEIACTVSRHKPIFVPIVSALARPCPESDGCATPHTPEALSHAAEGALDGVKLRVEVDGAELPETAIGHVQSSFWMNTPFESSERYLSCSGPIDTNECGITLGVREASTDMYAAMLRPLAKGTHVVHVVAKLPKEGTKAPAVVDLTWKLEAE